MSPLCLVAKSSLPGLPFAWHIIVQRATRTPLHCRGPEQPSKAPWAQQAQRPPGSEAGPVHTSPSAGPSVGSHHSLGRARGSLYSPANPLLSHTLPSFPTRPTALQRAEPRGPRDTDIPEDRQLLENGGQRHRAADSGLRSERPQRANTVKPDAPQAQSN